MNEFLDDERKRHYQLLLRELKCCDHCDSKVDIVGREGAVATSFSGLILAALSPLLIADKLA